MPGEGSQAVTLLVAMLAVALPAVHVDGSALADDAHGRRIIGHVVERLLEIGIAVDPRAEASLRVAEASDGYTVAMHRPDHVIASEAIEARGRERAVIELDVVQVAVDLARDHAVPTEPADDRVFVVVAPAAEAHRAELLGELIYGNATIVPTAEPDVTVVCLDTRGDDVVVATGESAEACERALLRSEAGDSIADAMETMREAAEPPTPPVAGERPTPPTTIPPRAPVRRRPQLGPWALGLRVGLGFGWRARAFDAAPAIGFEASARNGLAIGFDATVLPSRDASVGTADTLLAAGLGYRATFASGLHLSASASGGISVHTARVGRGRDVRVDPLLALPIQIEGDLGRRAALGARFTIASTFRGRIHAINGIEQVWRRGPVLLMLAATVRFGT